MERCPQCGNRLTTLLFKGVLLDGYQCRQCGWCSLQGDDRADTIRCEECGSTWAAENLAPIHDYWSRVDPGGVVPIGQCPNTECGALCYPTYGYAADLAARLANTGALLHAAQDVLTRLCDWGALMGGWDASVWEEARRLLTRLRSDTPHGQETPQPDVREPTVGES